MTESLVIFFIFSSANSLFAYIGPGMGGGVIAAIFGLIAAFFLILYYPIKRALKNKKKKKVLSKNKNYNKK